MIREVRAVHPDVVFLAEAFTRPKVMYRLAKIGFSQSYTYFTWRHTKAEFIEYLTELTQTAPKEFFRPHFFVNTPDINPVFLQTSGRGGFLIRAALAATLSGLWGVYAGFELLEAEPLPGREEYKDSEKYEIRPRPARAPGDIVAEITRLNRIRKGHPALQTHLGVSFLPGLERRRAGLRQSDGGAGRRGGRGHQPGPARRPGDGLRAAAVELGIGRRRDRGGRGPGLGGALHLDRQGAVGPAGPWPALCDLVAPHAPESRIVTCISKGGWVQRNVSSPAKRGRGTMRSMEEGAAAHPRLDAVRPGSTAKRGAPGAPSVGFAATSPRFAGEESIRRPYTFEMLMTDQPSLPRPAMVQGRGHLPAPRQELFRRRQRRRRRLRGLMAKLDYIAELGVTAVWLLPFYPSPRRDDGYDIAEYIGVHPEYGTLDDARRFIDAAHERGIRVITELVINHTSDQHPWFQAARAAPAGLARARLLRLVGRRREVAGDPHHLPGHRGLQLDLGPGGPGLLLAPLLQPPAGPELRQSGGAGEGAGGDAVLARRRR